MPRRVREDGSEFLSVREWFRYTGYAGVTGYALGLLGLPAVLIISGVQMLRARKRGVEVSRRRANMYVLLGGGIVLSFVGLNVYGDELFGETDHTRFLNRGDCLMGHGPGTFQASELSEPRLVACTEAHDAQVYRSGSFHGIEYPGEDTLSNAVLEACRVEAEVEFMLLPADPEVTLVYSWPDRDHWENEDHRYTCLIVADGGERFTRSVLAP